MRRMILLAVLTLTCLLPREASAQVELPVTPDPADCTAEPIDIDRLVALSSNQATPEAVAEATSVTATPTPDVVSQLTKVVVGSIACTNANQPLRALSYFTEDYLLRRISDEPAVTLGHLRAASSRQPDVAAPGDRVTIVSITPGPLVGGVASLEVETRTGTQSQLVDLSMVFQGSEWRIDHVSEAITD